MFERLRDDIAAVLDRDPAARSRPEVLLCYPGVHAVLVHRVAHRLWQARFFTLARAVSYVGRVLTGIAIHPGARIGRRVFIDHGLGLVIGESAEIDDDCTISHGVMLGGTSPNGNRRHPAHEPGVGAHDDARSRRGCSGEKPLDQV